MSPQPSITKTTMKALFFAVAVLSRRSRSDAIMARIQERAAYRRVVANNWGEAAPIDVNAIVKAEEIA